MCIMNNVLLINTSFRQNVSSQYSSFGPPMGLIAIASSLKASLYSVEIIDPQTDSEYMEKLLIALDKSPLFVGMSTYLGENLKHAMAFSKLIKRVRPDIPIVLGGPLASSVPDVFFREMPVDYIVMGSGELTIIKLADAIKNSGDPMTIPNISYIRNGKIVVGDIFVFDGCLDDLPVLDIGEWSDGVKNLQSIPIITSRGCHRGCSFCYNTFTGSRKFYLRSPESVLKEMEHWCELFNITTFQFFDDNFLLHPERALKIIEELKKRKWKVERLFGHLNEFDHVTPEQLAGCTKWIVMCIESASPRMQTVLNKKLDLEKALHVIKRITDSNIGFVTAFMFGLPGETDDDIRMSVEYAHKIRLIDNNNVSMCYIYAPQPKDAIVKSLGADHKIEFSIDAMSDVEVVPVPPDNKLDLRLRPWMTKDDQEFYLDFVEVWQYHFANHRNPDFDLTDVYSRNDRVRNLFVNIPPPREFNCSANIIGGLKKLKRSALRVLERNKTSDGKSTMKGVK